ncbi:MAG: GDP-mannose 4,6-dehydratase [Candidatus Edwardsbacteria bacterium]
MKVFITGIEGFAGHHLALDLLGKGEEVFGSFFAEETMGDLKKKCTLFRCDIRNQDEIAGILKEVKPEQVYHLAAQSSGAYSFKDSKSTFEINVMGTLNLLENILKYSPEAKTLVISSCEVYGVCEGSDLPTKEEKIFYPVSPYGTSKAAQDLLAYQYWRSFGLFIIRVRPFPHTGPGQNPVFVLPNFAKQIAEIERGEKEPVIEVGNLEVRRDFTDVRDIVKAYQLALTKGEPGEAYNICSGKTITIGETLKILLSFTKKEIAIKQDLSRMRPSDISVLAGDGTKFSRKTNWSPQIPFTQTLRDLLDWWREKYSS